MLMIGENLPPNLKRGTKAPRLVVRQEGNGVYFHFLRERTTFLSNVGLSSLSCVLEFFNPINVVYFYEPARLKGEPASTILDTLITVSPDPSRYKEFCKLGHTCKFYMPPYSRGEMLAIGNYGRNALGSSNEFVHEQWTDTAIEARFDEYGGIIRRVLPENLHGLEKHQMEYLQAIDALAFSLPEIARTLNADNISCAGSYLVQWGPTVSDDGEIYFGRLKNTFASEGIRAKILEKHELLTYDKLKATLVGCKRVHNTDVLTRNTDTPVSGSHGGLAMSVISLAPPSAVDA